MAARRRRPSQQNSGARPSTVPSLPALLPHHYLVFADLKEAGKLFASFSPLLSRASVSGADALLAAALADLQMSYGPFAGRSLQIEQAATLLFGYVYHDDKRHIRLLGRALVWRVQTFSDRLDALHLSQPRLYGTFQSTSVCWYKARLRVCEPSGLPSLPPATAFSGGRLAPLWKELPTLGASTPEAPPASRSSPKTEARRGPDPREIVLRSEGALPRAVGRSQIQVRAVPPVTAPGMTSVAGEPHAATAGSRSESEPALENGRTSLKEAIPTTPAVAAMRSSERLVHTNESTTGQAPCPTEERAADTSESARRVAEQVMKRDSDSEAKEPRDEARGVPQCSGVVESVEPVELPLDATQPIPLESVQPVDEAKTAVGVEPESELLILLASGGRLTLESLQRRICALLEAVASLESAPGAKDALDQIWNVREEAGILVAGLAQFNAERKVALQRLRDGLREIDDWMPLVRTELLNCCSEPVQCLDFVMHVARLRRHPHVSQKLLTLCLEPSGESGVSGKAVPVLLNEGALATLEEALGAVESLGLGREWNEALERAGSLQEALEAIAVTRSRTEEIRSVAAELDDETRAFLFDEIRAGVSLSEGASLARLLTALRPVLEKTFLVSLVDGLRDPSTRPDSLARVRQFADALNVGNQERPNGRAQVGPVDISAPTNAAFEKTGLTVEIERFDGNQYPHLCLRAATLPAEATAEVPLRLKSRQPTNLRLQVRNAEIFFNGRNLVRGGSDRKVFDPLNVNEADWSQTSKEPAPEWVATVHLPLLLERPSKTPHDNRLAVTVRLAADSTPEFEVRGTLPIRPSVERGGAPLSVDWPKEGEESIAECPLGIQTELKVVEAEIEKGGSFLVTAPRRFGKTALLRYLVENAQVYRERSGALLLKHVTCSEYRGRERFVLVWQQVNQTLAEQGLPPFHGALENNVPNAKAFDLTLQAATMKGVSRIVLLFDEAQVLLTGREGEQAAEALKNRLENGWRTEACRITVGLVGLPALLRHTNLALSIKGIKSDALREGDLIRLIRRVTASGLATSRDARTLLAEYSVNLRLLQDLLTDLAGVATQRERTWVSGRDVRMAVSTFAEELRAPGEPMAGRGRFFDEWGYTDATAAEPEARESLLVALAARELQRRGNGDHEHVDPVGLAKCLEAWASREGGITRIHVLRNNIEKALRELSEDRVLLPNGAFPELVGARLDGLLNWKYPRRQNVQSAYVRLSREYIPRPSCAEALSPGGTGAAIYRFEEEGGEAYAFRETVLRDENDPVCAEAEKGLLGLLDRFETRRMDWPTGLYRLRQVGRAIDDPRVSVQVYRWIDGQSLAEWQARDSSTMPIWRVASIGEEIAEALRWLHEQDVLHRDVAPRNVIVSEGDLRPVLIDLGMAWFGIERESKTRADANFGAPELRTSGGRWSQSADVYSLCETLKRLTDRCKGQEGQTELWNALRDGLDENPRRRPSAREVHSRLVEVRERLRSWHSLSEEWSRVVGASEAHWDGLRIGEALRHSLAAHRPALCLAIQLPAEQKREKARIVAAWLNAALESTSIQEPDENGRLQRLSLGMLKYQRRGRAEESEALAFAHALRLSNAHGMLKEFQQRLLDGVGNSQKCFDLVRRASAIAGGLAEEKLGGSGSLPIGEAARAGGVVQTLAERFLGVA